jgi:hypothetical protein
MATPKRKTLPAAKAGPEDAEQSALIQQLDRQRVRAEAKTEAKAVAQAKAASQQREPVPANYAVRDTTMRVVSPDMAQVILGAIRDKVPSAIAVLRQAEQERPDMLRALIAEFRREGERRPEIFLALLEAR